MPYHALFCDLFSPRSHWSKRMILGEILGSWTVPWKMGALGPVVWIPDIPSIKRDCYLLRGTPQLPGPKATNFQLRALYLWKSPPGQWAQLSVFRLQRRTLGAEGRTQQRRDANRWTSMGCRYLGFIFQKKHAVWIYIYIYVNIMIMKMRFQFLRYFLCWTTSSHTLGFGTWWLLLFAVVGTVIYNFRDSNWG